MNQNEKIVSTFNSFNGKNLEILAQFYSEDVEFRDPAKVIRGLDELKKYYHHIYSNVEEIRFDFQSFISDGGRICGEWEMSLTIKVLGRRQSYKVPGCSIFRFNDKGLVEFHRDYVDLGAMVYEQIPLLGSLVKVIKQRL